MTNDTQRDRYVPELGRELTPAEWAIWTGTSDRVTPEQRDKYLRLWKEQAAGVQAGAVAPAVQKPLAVTVAPPTISGATRAVQKLLPATAAPACPYRSAGPTGEKVGCRACARTSLPVYGCSIHGRCVTDRAPTSDAIKCCRWCPDNPANVRAGRLPPPAAAQGMVMPGDRRPHIWRGGVLQIWTTRACDRACYGCTQGSNLAGKPTFITPDQFRVAVESVVDYFGVVGVFGGNPCLHGQFDELCRILRGRIPWEQRGLWSNHPQGTGPTCRITFNPKYSNLNVHQSREAFDEFARDWPECRPYLKGLDRDSRHAPPFVAMKDVIPDEAERWRLIQSCDVNRSWSAMICVFRGQLRGFFCELAAAQAMLHQDDPEYPDTGVPVVPGWWRQGPSAFQGQIQKHCHECSIPLRGHGALANSGPTEQVSETHRAVYRPKRPDRQVEVVTNLIQLGPPLPRATDYIENGTIQ